MSVSRRAFLASSAAALSVPAGLSATEGSSTPHVRDVPAGEGYDPWLEIDPAALEHNVQQLSRLCGGRPIFGVVKNNAYGLGLTTVGPLLEGLKTIAGLAVVKPDQALALRDAGVRKPILLMSLFDARIGTDLVARDIQLAPFTDDAGDRLARIARRLNRQVPVHLYLDTGMSRLGMPYRRAGPWIAALAERDEIQIKGVFMTFTEEDDFDAEQLERFLAVARDAEQKKIELGRLHAASSHGLFHRPEAHLDMVRPGLALYGAYPDGAQATATTTLRAAFSLRARVVRVERLERGDTVSYGRDYVAERPTWVATLPVGHADGYPRKAVNGCEVLIGGSVYPVIGAVSASHSIVEVGEQRSVNLGDEAVLIGPEHEAIHPNTIADRAEVSVYDVLMHLSARLPKTVRG